MSNPVILSSMAVLIAEEPIDWQGLYDQLRTELAAYKAQPFVPASEHARCVEQRDAALRLLDSMAGDGDEATRALADQRLELLQAVGRVLDRMAPGHEERAAFNALFAHLAEFGR